MATTGAPYNIPYYIGSDPPAGFAQQEALAVKLATELARIDAAAGALQSAYDSHAAASANVHGTGSGNSVVGTGTPQTLLNKTMDFRGGVGFNSAANVLWSAVVQGVGGTTLTTKLSTIDSAISALQAGSGVAPTWASITGKPATYPATAHTHSYAAVSHSHSQYAASSHSHSQYLESTDTIKWANGSERVRGNSASGSGTYYSVWVDGSDRFCKNTSSRRYKKNIRDHEIDPANVLALRPVMFDRKNGAAGEFGLIAEETDPLIPEITVRDDAGVIDSIRYDLLPVAMLAVLKDQQRRIEQLEGLLGT